jgi:hypothetical protein
MKINFRLSPLLLSIFQVIQELIRTQRTSRPMSTPPIQDATIALLQDQLANIIRQLERLQSNRDSDPQPEEQAPITVYNTSPAEAERCHMIICDNPLSFFQNDVSDEDFWDHFRRYPKNAARGYVPPKIPNIIHLSAAQKASKLVNKGSCTVRQLSSFIDKATVMTAAVFPARLKVQHLLADKIQALKSDISWETSVSLTPAAMEELLWWRTHLHQWNGLSWIVSTPQMDIYTDASDDGWGVVVNNKSFSGS